MSIISLLNQSITIYTKGAQDKFGKTSFGAGVVYSARFEQENTTITTAQKEREPIDGRIFVASDCVVGLGDKLTFDGEDYRVMRRSKQIVGAGSMHHIELLVQLWSI